MAQAIVKFNIPDGKIEKCVSRVDHIYIVNQDHGYVAIDSTAYKAIAQSLQGIPWQSYGQMVGVVFVVNSPTHISVQTLLHPSVINWPYDINGNDFAFMDLGLIIAIGNDPKNGISPINANQLNDFLTAHNIVPNVDNHVWSNIDFSPIDKFEEDNV